MSTSARLMTAMLTLLLHGVLARSAAAADSFPPAWAVGDTWKVRVKVGVPNIEGRANTERLFDFFTKTYLVAADDEKVDGNPVYTLQISFDTSDDSYVVHLDKTRRFLIDYTLSRGKKVLERGVNDVAPDDSLVNGLPGSDRTMLDFMVFPVPNANEDRQVVAPKQRRLQGYSQNIVFTPTGATILVTSRLSADIVISTTQQVWRTGAKWPESAVLSVPAAAGGLIDHITETLIH